jgi:predicted O-methyltransferase YrrM
LGYRTCKVNSTDRSAGEACLRGLVVGGVVVVDNVFRDLIRDVMKARDCGSVIVSW